MRCGGGEWQQQEVFALCVINIRMKEIYMRSLSMCSTCLPSTRRENNNSNLLHMSRLIRNVAVQMNVSLINQPIYKWVVANEAAGLELRPLALMQPKFILLSGILVLNYCFSLS